MLPELPSIADSQTLMRQGKLRPIDLVEHSLGRIHQFEDQIHAWVMVDEEGARAEAQRLGKMLDDGHEPVGPLHGIPIGIKDIIDVAGWPTLCGSKLREGHVAEEDATVVEDLRQAGAIILGKTVTTEWASFDLPPTRNPWNLNHTPGGSSSGSAAAVAMEMCMAALGTQTGGSIIRPASYCGVVGLKPQFDEIDSEGIYPFAKNLDHPGPIARTVADAKVTWSVLSRRSRTEVSRLSCPWGEAFSLAVLKGDFALRADDETCAAFVHAVSKFAKAGVAIREFAVPDCLSDVHLRHRQIMAYEAAQVHRERLTTHREEFAPKILSLLEEGSQLAAHEYDLALETQRLAKEFFWSLELWKEPQLWAIIMPATPTAAPSTATTGDPVFNSPWSFTGLPSITIPYAESSEGLPLGMQIVHRYSCELLRIAQDFETFLSWKRHPKLMGAN